MAKSTAKKVFPAPPQACYDVIWDFEKYPEFVGELKAARRLEGKGNKALVEFTAKVIKEVKYTLDLNGKPPYEIRWTMTKGFFKKNDGGWILRDLGDGTTEATYEIDVEFGLMVPGSVVKMLQEVNLPRMLDAFHRRIAQLNK